MAISCLALNENAPLREADIEQNFMIDFVFVTDRWEIYVPTSIGNIPLRIAGEGLKIRASFQNDELKRADNEEMDPNLGPAISQAIRDDPRIGRVWVAQFTLFAALDAETQYGQLVPCDWYEALATAQEKLAGIKGTLTSYNHHDPSTKQEVPANRKGDNDLDVLGAYQINLRHLDSMGNRMLKDAAKHS